MLARFDFGGRAARQAEERALILACEPPGNNPEHSNSYVRLPDFRKSA